MEVCHFLVSSILALLYVNGEDVYGERHKYQFSTQMEHLKEIPRRFEVKGDNAVADFKSYINDVQELARRENMTLAYRIKVDVFTPKQRLLKKEMLRKIKTKKYNVPLKKKNMKLSNFEMALRKRAKDHANSHRIYASYEEKPVTTEKQQVFYSTKSAWHGKYKPIVSQVKTNYTKIIRPVRNKVITLFV